MDNTNNYNEEYNPMSQYDPFYGAVGNQAMNTFGGSSSNNNFRRENNDYNNNMNRNNRGGGAMRDPRRRERFNDNNKPYNKSNKPNARGRAALAKHEYQEDSDYHGYDDNNERLPPHIESRVAREKPCRTLFVRNVQYAIPENEVRALFEKHGEIKDVFNLIENRGMIFITFYDVRAAERAKHALQGTYLAERKIDVHYSLPKEEEEKARCDRTKNQGTLLFTLKGSSIELDDNELHRLMSSFGEVKAIRVPNFKKSQAHNYSQHERNQQRLVEFYDSRACVAAYDATYDKEYNGGRWDVAFFWDHPYKERVNSHARREKNSEREDNMGRNRRRSDSTRRDYNSSYNSNEPLMGTHNVNSNHHYTTSPNHPAPHLNPIPTGLPSSADPRLQQYNQYYQQQSPLQQPLGIAPPAAAAATSADTVRLEQAQKAQQILSMLAQQQQQQQQQQQHQQPATQQLTAPFQPTNIQSPPVPQQQMPLQPHQQQQPQSYVPPVPPTEDQASQVQQLLGLLSQAAQQQHTPAQQSAQLQPHSTAAPAPIISQGVAPIPGMDPATALTQLAALLQQQQHQQNQ
ncbi:hypothetical protein BDF20DRAFT_463588 [Mycotypha africana]|uniref:uncharacterized protein n=1 Tax=Mycotypha africana TaxID=64632 RepID=UPI00230046DC|nr:uncharacterized protein BDF20DRAFT_463588 [Mycotypha africana]KAI8982310.1 hypothetical protein BDF20DRAFT_463588 [Mycotypha africana]